MGRGLASDYPDGPLEILPGGSVLGEGSSRAGSAVFERDHGDSQGVEVSAHWSHLEIVRVIIFVAASGVDYLDGVGLELMGEVPLDVWFALVLLAARHIAFGPDGFFLIAGTVFVGRVAVHKFLFGLDGAEITHLGHELDSPLETICAVFLIGVEVEFGGNFTLAQFPVNQRGTIGGVGVLSSVVKADGAGVGVELEDFAYGHVAAISFAECRGAFFIGIGSDVCRCIGHRPVDVARHGIQFIYRFVCRSLRTGGQQQG